MCFGKIKKVGFCLSAAVIIFSAIGCGEKAENEKEVGAVLPMADAESGKMPETVPLQGTETVDAESGKMPETVSLQDAETVGTARGTEPAKTSQTNQLTEAEKEPRELSESLKFFELPDAAIALLRLEEQEPDSFSFYRSVLVDGMEFAVLDCGFIEENAFSDGSAYIPATEQFTSYYPNLVPKTKLFLRRAEGAEFWEAAVMEHVSENDAFNNPYIAFPSKENGMVIWSDEYACIYVTEDGGATWTLPESIPSPARSVVGSIQCIISCGEGRFLVGHRYKGTPEAGQLSLTEDNGRTWKEIALPEPPTGELEFCYSEPLGFRQEDGKLFVQMRMYAEDTTMEKGDGWEDRFEAYYNVVSVDGGLTWNLEKLLDFYPVGEGRTAFAGETSGLSVSNTKNAPVWAKVVETKAQLFTGLNLDGVGDSDDSAYISIYHLGDYGDSITALRIHLGTGETISKIFPVNGIYSFQTGKLFSEDKDAIILDIQDLGSNYNAATIFAVEVSPAGDSFPEAIVRLDTTNSLVPLIYSGVQVIDIEDSPLQGLEIPSWNPTDPKRGEPIKNIFYWDKENREWIQSVE